MKKFLLILSLTIIFLGCSNEHSIDVKFSEYYQNKGYMITDFVAKNSLEYEIHFCFISNKMIEEYLIATFYDKDDRELRKFEIGPNQLESKSAFYKLNNPSFQYFITAGGLDTRLIYRIIISKE